MEKRTAGPGSRKVIIKVHSQQEIRSYYKYQSGGDNFDFKNGQDVCIPVSVRLVVHTRPQAGNL